MLIVIGSLTALQFLFTYAGFMQTLFGSRALDIGHGLAVAAAGSWWYGMRAPAGSGPA